MQAVGIGKHHHAMPLLTQFMHDGNHFGRSATNTACQPWRTARSLAVSHLMTQRLCERFVANFPRSC